MTEEQIQREKKLKTVNMKAILNSIKEIYLNSRVQAEIIYTMDCYLEYIDSINQMDAKNKKMFFELLKMDEILLTQLIERSNYEIIINSMMDENIRKDSIDYMMNKVLKQSTLSQRNVKFAHKILIDGSVSENLKEKLNNFRGSDLLWVGGWHEGEPVIQYFPPDYSEIRKDLQAILDFLNDDEYHNSELDCFVHPIIVHALISILQPFYDGNTRLSRLLQSAYFVKNTNNIYHTNFHLPLFNLSKIYCGLSAEYRTLISKLAVSPTSEHWCSWILFNLRNIQTNIDQSIEIIQENQLTKK